MYDPIIFIVSFDLRVGGDRQDLPTAQRTQKDLIAEKCPDLL